MSYDDAPRIYDTLGGDQYAGWTAEQMDSEITRLGRSFKDGVRQWEAPDVLAACSDVLAVRAGQSASDGDVHPLARAMLRDNNRPSLQDLAKKIATAVHGETVKTWKPDQFFAMSGSPVHANFGDLLSGLANNEILSRMPRLLNVPMTLARHIELKNFYPRNIGSVELEVQVDPATHSGGGLSELQTIQPRGVGEQLALRRSAIRLVFGFEMQVVDNIDAFLRTLEAALVSCAQNELAYFAALLESPPDLSDGNPFWDSSNSLSLGAAPSEATLNSAISALGAQLVNGQKSDARLRYLLVPSALSATAEKLARETFLPGVVRVLTSAFLDGNYWYIFSDPQDWPVAVRGTLRGDSETGVSLSAGATNLAEDARSQVLRGMHAYDYGLISRVGVVRITAS